MRVRVRARARASQPTVSHHLKKLTDAGLLDREQRGKWAYFSINPEAAASSPASSTSEGPMMTTTADELREEVRRRYAEAARAVIEGSSADVLR